MLKLVAFIVPASHLLAVTALLAGLGPTRRALSVDPIQALRYE